MSASRDDTTAELLAAALIAAAAVEAMLRCPQCLDVYNNAVCLEVHANGQRMTTTRCTACANTTAKLALSTGADKVVITTPTRKTTTPPRQAILTKEDLAPKPKPKPKRLKRTRVAVYNMWLNETITVNALQTGVPGVAILTKGVFPRSLTHTETGQRIFPLVNDRVTNASVAEAALEASRVVNFDWTSFHGLPGKLVEPPEAAHRWRDAFIEALRRKTP